MTQYEDYSGGGGIRFRLIVGLVIALFGVVTYCMDTSVNPTTGEVQHVSMTPEQETALGLQTEGQMAAQMGGEAEASDQKAQEVSYVGQLIVQRTIIKRTPYHFQFHLLNDQKTINAFALPGGQVFITRGLYDKLADEAELAAVLGHEIGHVVQRHAAQQYEQARLGQTLVMATGVAESDRRDGLATTAAAVVANQMMQLHFSRHDEAEADAFGREYMIRAGYDPRAMIDLMKILRQASGDSHTPEFLQTHPDPGDRIEAIEQWVDAHPDRLQNLTRGNPL